MVQNAQKIQKHAALEIQLEGANRQMISALQKMSRGISESVLAQTELQTAQRELIASAAIGPQQERASAGFTPATDTRKESPGSRPPSTHVDALIRNAGSRSQSPSRQ